MDPSAQHFQVLRDGIIVQAGKFRDLLQNGTDFSTLICAHNEALENMKINASMRKDDGLNTPYNGESDVDSKAKSKTNNEQNKDATCAVIEGEVASNGNVAHLRQLVKEEERERGQVSYKVYWAYATDVAGGAFVPVYLLAQIGFQALQILNSYWMAWGTASAEGGSAHVSTKTLIIVYIFLALAGTISMLVRAITVSMVGLKTAQNFFLKMLRSVFRAPMSFFDSTPSGRILNRVSVSIISQVLYPHMWIYHAKL